MYSNYSNDNKIIEHFWPFDSKGDKGDTGSKGDQGPKGETGPPGPDLRNIQLDNLTLKFNNATVY
jgi:hypothetical protein